MLKRRTLWPTRRRFPWPQRPRFRWPVAPSNILIKPDYPTLTLPDACGCCGGVTVPCCPGPLPDTIYVTIAGGGSCGTNLNGTYPLVWNAAGVVGGWACVFTGADGHNYRMSLAPCSFAGGAFTFAPPYSSDYGCASDAPVPLSSYTCSPFSASATVNYSNGTFFCACNTGFGSMTYDFTE